MKRRWTVVALVGLLIAGLTMSSSVAQDVVVGGKNFTEQFILSKISVLALQANGFDVQDRSNLGSTTQNRIALQEGQIDHYWEYNGTAVSNFVESLGLEETEEGNIVDATTGEVAPVGDGDRLTAFVATRDAAHNDLIWLDRTAFNNSFELVASPEFADTLADVAGKSPGDLTISDLAAAINAGDVDPALCVGTEFRERDQDGLPEIEETYDFQFNRNKIQDVGTNLSLGFELLIQGDCQVTGTLFTTDGRIALENLVVLEDDQSVFPAFNPSPIFRGEVLRDNPEIASIIGEIPQQLTQEVQTCLNARVDVLLEEPEEVAQLFLDEQGCPPPQQ